MTAEALDRDQLRGAVLDRLATFTERVQWVGEGASNAFADSILELVDYLNRWGPR